MSWCSGMDGDSDGGDEIDVYDEFVASVRVVPRRSARRAVKKGCKGHDGAFSCANCWTGKIYFYVFILFILFFGQC